MHSPRSGGLIRGARRDRLQDADRPQGLAGWLTVALAIVLAASPLASGYFDFNIWGALELGSIVLLLAVCRTSRPTLTREGAVAVVALLVLLALSAASMLWAESKDSAWTSVNRLGLYAVVFLIALMTVRDRRIGRVLILVLGSAALLTSLWLCGSFLLGGNQGAFLLRRLNAPIGYINGTAGMLVMGLWPWLAWAESTSRRLTRAAALAAAALIAGTLVLTESRAPVPALVLTALFVLLCAPGRLRRALSLAMVVAAAVAALPWTLPVYTLGGAAERSLPPSHSALQAAAIAILIAALAAGIVQLGLLRLIEGIDPEYRARVGRSASIPMLVGSLVVLVVGIIAISPWIGRQYRSFTAVRLNQAASVRFVDASGYRYDYWRIAVRQFQSHPLGGVGAGNYDVSYYRQRKNPDYVLQPHSLELQMAAELGLGGFAALLVFCGAVIWAAFRRSATLASEDRLIKVAAAGVLVAWLLDTSVDWLYDIPGITGLAMIAAALLIAPAVGTPTGGLATRRRLAPRVVVPAAVALALLAASVGRQYVAARYAQAGATKVQHSPRAAIGELRTAAALDPYSVSTLYSLASAFARQGNYHLARSTLLLAAAREPHNYVPPALLGDLAVRHGDFPRAAAEYRRALELNPRDEYVRVALTRATHGKPSAR